MSREEVLTHARIVLPDAVIDGSVCMRDGAIAAVESGASSLPGAEDLDGDVLVPGLVDLHTDALETHLEPRTGVFWDGTAAAVAHDAVTIAAGVTTVFDAVCVGAVAGRPMDEEGLDTMLAGLTQAAEDGSLRAEHHIHLRCEVTDPDVTRMLEHRIGHDLVKLVSVMDHAPGHRQMKDTAHLRDTWMIGKRGLTPEAADREIDELMRRSREVAPVKRKEVTDMAHGRSIAVASHDDETVEHIDLAADLGIDIAEFPTTEEAAHEAHGRGIAVLMGGPNLVRGGSHSGNVAAGDLAKAGVLDALMSDYIMSSMLMGAWALTGPQFGWSLPDAVALVAANPARIAGLDDRGRIEAGLRADLVRVSDHDGRPVVRAAWRQGQRVF